MKSYIFKKDFEHRYNKAFQDYAIHVFYGDNILLAEDLLQNKEEDAE